MGQARQRAPAHPGRQLREGGLAREVGAHGHLVHEEADNMLSLNLAPVGNISTYHKIILTCVVVQEYIECCEQNHEQRRSLLPSQGLEIISKRRW